MSNYSQKLFVVIKETGCEKLYIAYDSIEDIPIEEDVVAVYKLEAVKRLRVTKTLEDQ